MARSHAAALPRQNLSATFLQSLAFQVDGVTGRKCALGGGLCRVEQSEWSSSVFCIWSSLRYLARATFRDLPPALCVFLWVSDRSWVPSRFM